MLIQSKVGADTKCLCLCCALRAGPARKRWNSRIQGELCGHAANLLIESALHQPSYREMAQQIFTPPPPATAC